MRSTARPTADGPGPTTKTCSARPGRGAEPETARQPHDRQHAAAIGDDLVVLEQATVDGSTSITSRTDDCGTANCCPPTRGDDRIGDRQRQRQLDRGSACLHPARVERHACRRARCTARCTTSMPTPRPAARSAVVTGGESRQAEEVEQLRALRADRPRPADPSRGRALRPPRRRCRARRPQSRA